jgi:hypothetical protein
MTSFRTDRNNNPTAFTTDIARLGGLLPTDYNTGEPFQSGTQIYFTAKLTGDPIALTLKVIDALGFYTTTGHLRWIYIGIPRFIWDKLDRVTKIQVIHFMYKNEGGTAMEDLFK